jgi:hypothetical protein
MTRTTVALLLSGLVAATGTFLACNSGNTGAPGPIGNPGPAATAVAASGPAGGGCTVPCHGFQNSIVSQWRSSKHYAASALAISTPTVLLNTQYCGNCHAGDGMEHRLANEVTTLGNVGGTNVNLGHLNYINPDGGVSQVLYAGGSNSTLIHCTTCHAFNKDNDPHVTGQYQQVPLRVPSGEDRVYLEKSPDPDAGLTGMSLPTAYGPGNTCMFCHKSPRDVSFYITKGKPISITARWGPHNGTQAELFTGEGGYRFPGQTYNSSIHSTLPNGCTKCHMPPVIENNNLPDHSYLPRLSTCGASNCHAGTISTFDLAVAPHDPKKDAGQTVVKALLGELRLLLCPPAGNGTGDGGADAPCLLSRVEATPPASAPVLTGTELTDGDFALDFARTTTPTISVPTDTAGALFNYLVVVKSRDNGTHNPIYTQQLLWDSIQAYKGSPSTVMPTRPTPLPAP